MQLQKKQNKIQLFFFYLLWYIKNYRFFFNFIFILKNKLLNFFIYKEKKVTNKDLENFFTSKKLLNKLFKIGKIYNFSKASIFLKRRKLLRKKIKNFGGAADINLIYNISLKTKPTKILETGVALGWSSLAFLHAINKNKRGSLISIDMPYMYKKTKNYVGSAVPRKYYSKWKLYKYPDRVILNKILRKYNLFDLVHYDSDKSYYGRYWFYKSIWPHIKKNGLLISDDVKDNYAFFDFARLINKKYYLIKNNKKYSGLIIK